MREIFIRIFEYWTVSIPVLWFGAVYTFNIRGLFSRTDSRPPCRSYRLYRYISTKLTEDIEVLNPIKSTPSITKCFFANLFIVFTLASFDMLTILMSGHDSVIFLSISAITDLIDGASGGNIIMGYILNSIAAITIPIIIYYVIILTSSLAFSFFYWIDISISNRDWEYKKSRSESDKAGVFKDLDEEMKDFNE